MDEKKVQAIMNLIIYGGDGKSSSVEAIQAAKEGNFELACERDRGRISYDSKRAVKYSVRKRKDRI